MAGQHLKVQAKAGLVEVINYLEHLVKSLKEGQLCIRKNGEAITMKPQDPVMLDLEAEARLEKDSLREKLVIELKWKKDEQALSEMLYSLSEQSVRTRYMTRTMAFPHKDVQQLTNVDYRNNLAIVGMVPGPGGEDIVAIAQYYLDPKTQAAEVAFLVQDEWQAKGMGTFLLDYITQVARQRGVKRFYAKVLADNRPMLAIFQNSGYRVNVEFDGDVYNISYDITKKEE